MQMSTDISFVDELPSFSKKQMMQQQIRGTMADMIINGDSDFVYQRYKLPFRPILYVNNGSSKIEISDTSKINGSVYIAIPTNYYDALDAMTEDEKAQSSRELILNSMKAAEKILYQGASSYNPMAAGEYSGKDIGITSSAMSEPMMEFSFKSFENEKAMKSDPSCPASSSSKGKGQSSSGGKEEGHGESADSASEDMMYSYSDTDHTPRGATLTKGLKKFTDERNTERMLKVLEHDKPHLNAIAKRLAKSFRGYAGREGTSSPKKKIRSRHLVSDYTDKIYENRIAPDGKRIDDFVFLIDMSGSMSGEPVRNAMRILYVFNKLAKEGLLTGHVIYSQTRSNGILKLPYSNEDDIAMLTKTGSAEGLEESMNEHWDIIKQSSNVICITDGKICDAPIDKTKLAKNKVHTIGIYVNKDMENPLDYTGSLNQWFEKSLVRKTVDQAIDKLVYIGLKGKAK